MTLPAFHAGTFGEWSIRGRGERIEARTSTALVAFVGSFHGVFVRKLIEVAPAEISLERIPVT
jgi:hypothetical protein